MLSPTQDISAYISEIFRDLICFFLHDASGLRSVKITLKLLNQIIDRRRHLPQSQAYDFIFSFFYPNHHVTKSAEDLKEFLECATVSGWDQACGFNIVSKFIEISQSSWAKETFAFTFFSAVCSEVLEKQVFTEMLSRKNPNGEYIAKHLFQVVANEVLAEHAPSIATPIESLTPPSEPTPENVPDSYNFSDCEGSLDICPGSPLFIDDAADESNLVFGSGSTDGQQLGVLPAPILLPQYAQLARSEREEITPLAKTILQQLFSDKIPTLLEVRSLGSNTLRG